MKYTLLFSRLFCVYRVSEIVTNPSAASFKDKFASAATLTSALQTIESCLLTPLGVSAPPKPQPPSQSQQLVASVAAYVDLK
jgi:hypothetical protein